MVRALLAYFFAAILLFVIWKSFANANNPELWEQTKELLELVLPGVTALLGSVVGFYFGSQRTQ